LKEVKDLLKRIYTLLCAVSSAGNAMEKAFSTPAGKARRKKASTKRREANRELSTLRERLMVRTNSAMMKAGHERLKLEGRKIRIEIAIDKHNFARMKQTNPKMWKVRGDILELRKAQIESQLG
jgi:hypothetical protein